MIGIDCYNENQVRETLTYLRNEGRTYVDGLYDEIMTAIDELGYPVVITDEKNVGYFFGEYKEEKVEIIDFKDYMNSQTLEVDGKDLIKALYKHLVNNGDDKLALEIARYFIDEENKISINDKTYENYRVLYILTVILGARVKYDVTYNEECYISFVEKFTVNRLRFLTNIQNIDEDIYQKYKLKEKEIKK